MGKHSITQLMAGLAAVGLGGAAAPAAAATVTAHLLYQFVPPSGTSIELAFPPTVAVGGSAAGQVLANQNFRGAFDAAVWSSTGTPTDLNPPNAYQSSAAATNGLQTVGYTQSSSRSQYASLWTGTSNSPTDLNPSGFTFSAALGLSALQQVGWATVTAGADNAFLWTGSAAGATNLNPTGFVYSHAVATDGTHQVGNGYTSSSTQNYHALLWNNTANSVIDLNPAGYTQSWALGVGGAQQVGYGIVNPPVNGDEQALLWTGSAAQVTTLTPQGFETADAVATNGSQQVGFGFPTGATSAHALLWSGSAQTAVDLQASLPADFYASQAQSIDALGDVFGFAFHTDANYSTVYAVEWTAPEPTTCGLLGVVVAGLVARRRMPRGGN